MAKTRRGRLKQVENWLWDRFPTPLPITVRVIRLTKGPRKRDRVDAHFYRKGRRLHIDLDSRMHWTEAISALIHEWAHAISIQHAVIEDCKVQDHDEVWGINYAKVHRAYYDEEGYIESRGYPEK